VRKWVFSDATDENVSWKSILEGCLAYPVKEVGKVVVRVVSSRKRKVGWGAGDVAQAQEIECLPSKCRVTSSNSSTAKKKIASIDKIQSEFFEILLLEPGMVVHACNPSTQEAETET
jgi:hypothetical protein